VRTLRTLVRSLRDVETAVRRTAERSDAIDERLAHLEHEATRDREALREMRDSLDYQSRRAPFRGGRTRVVFLVHLIEAWDGCTDVVRAMQASLDFEPIVVSIPRHFNGDVELGFEEDVHQRLQREGVAHLRVRPADVDRALAEIKRLDPDLVFRQSQWDADIPEQLSTESLAFVRTGLIPYETMNIVQNVPNQVTHNSAVDSPYHRAAWVVFCANDLMVDMARRDGAIVGSQFKVVGHPKADRIRGASPYWPVANNASRANTWRVAWSAHHSIGTGWTDFGAFPQLAAEMLEWARRGPNIEFVFLPHPALVPFTCSPDCPMTRAEFDAWKDEWLALSNTGISTHGRYPSVLAASDLLVTDGLSLLVEYQLLQRPLVFFERPGHRPFNQLGEQVRKGAHTVSTATELRSTVEQLLSSGVDPLRAQQQDNVERLFGGDSSVDRIMSTLRQMIAAEHAAPDLRSSGVSLPWE
jgi:hypothetical protein